MGMGKHRVWGRLVLVLLRRRRLQKPRGYGRRLEAKLLKVRLLHGSGRDAL
jgi:hypothetical protein